MSKELKALILILINIKELVFKNFKTICVLLFTLFFSTSINAIENKILIKINNEIVTTHDISSEIKYLKILNPNLNEIDEDTINKIAKNSIIKEKIKKIEISKNKNNLVINEKYLNQLIKNIYTNLNIDTKDEFEKYLSINKLNLEMIKNKISIEALWNEIIFFKFSKKIKINKQNLERKIKESEKKFILSYELFEIIFNVDNKEELSKKFKEIKYDIEEKGFSSAASIHSISDTSKIGGKLGWISEKSLSNEIKKELSFIKEGQYSKPIITPGGILILKINKIQKEKVEINFENELKKLINIETNKQLNQFSYLYFNKIKKNIQINEL